MSVLGLMKEVELVKRLGWKVWILVIEGVDLGHRVMDGAYHVSVL